MKTQALAPHAAIETSTPNQPPKGQTQMNRISFLIRKLANTAPKAALLAIIAVGSFVLSPMAFAGCSFSPQAVTRYAAPGQTVTSDFTISGISETWFSEGWVTAWFQASGNFTNPPPYVAYNGNPPDTIYSWSGSQKFHLPASSAGYFHVSVPPNATAGQSEVLQTEVKDWFGTCAATLTVVVAPACSSPSNINAPGAASTNNWNEFYAVGQDGQVKRYSSDAWTAIETPTPSYAWACPPAAPQPDGSFFMVEYFPSNDVGSHLVQYDATTQSWIDYGGPPGASIVTTPSEVMYGNRVYLIAQNLNGDNNVWEMKFGAGQGTWTKFTNNTGYGGASPSTPSVLYDGSLFFIDSGGELINMWWNGSQWIFLNNGYCQNAGWGTAPVTALYVGAPMDSSKVFVTCSDGTLRQRWYDGANGKWYWINQGKPTWYLNHNPVTAYADTRPIALGSGHVFLNASTSSSGTNFSQTLVQLWYSGSQSGWIWVPSGYPPTTGLAYGDVAGDPGYPPNVYARGQDGHIWDAQYDANTSKFVWLDLGTP